MKDKKFDDERILTKINDKISLVGLTGLLIVLVVLSLITVSAYTGAGNIKSTNNQFNNAYVSFDYPSNWIVTTDNSSNGDINIQLSDSNDNNTDNINNLTLTTSTLQQEDILYPQSTIIIHNSTTPVGYKYTGYSYGLTSNWFTDLGAFIQNGTNIYWLNIGSFSTSKITLDDSHCYSTVLNSLQFK